MKPFNKSLILLLLFLCSGWMGAQSIEVIPQQGSDAQLKAGFESEQLSHRQVIAFQHKAEQVVADFLDYYQLLQENELDDDLRNEVIRVMSSLFNAPTDTIVLDKVYQVQDLAQLDFSKLPRYQLDRVLTVEIALNYQSPQKVYLPLTVVLKGQSETGSSMAILIRDNKSFGYKTQLVWDVQLTRLHLGF
jgi:hypothetical protein